MELPPGWAEAMDTATRRGGICLVVGAVDTGKSTFCGWLAQRAAQAGLSAAVVDSDTGQQDIGPPACVTFAWADPQAARLEELPLAGLHFVGATSPLGHLLELVAGACRLAGLARRQGAALVAVDTTGLVEGPGLGLKWAKVSALAPRTLVALQQGAELEPLLAPYRQRERPLLLRLRPSPLAQARSATTRAARRREMFRRYFAGAGEVAIPWEQLGVEGLPLFAGPALAAAERRRLESAWGMPVLHAEAGPAGRLAVMEGSWGVEGWRTVPAANFDRLLVGLVDDRGRTLGAGSLRGWPDQPRFRVVTPAGVEAVRTLKLGFMRVDPGGEELGTVRW